jgi:hypothetical protein
MESSPTQLIRFSFQFGYEPLFTSSFFGALILALSHPSFTARSSAYRRQFKQWFLTPFPFKPTRPDEPVPCHAEEFGDSDLLSVSLSDGGSEEIHVDDLHA